LEGRRFSESEQFGQKSSVVEIFGFAQQTQFFASASSANLAFDGHFGFSIELH